MALRDRRSVDCVECAKASDGLVADRLSFLKAIARLHTIGVDAFSGLARARSKGQRTGIVRRSGGLGLPDRDYYIKTDEDSKKKSAAYIARYKMLTLLGRRRASCRRRNKIMSFETALAKASRTRVELRSAETTQMSPLIWKSSRRIGIGQSISRHHLAEPGILTLVSDFFKGQCGFNKTSIDDWKTYYAGI